MLQVLSRPSGFFLKPVANMPSSSDSGANLLSYKRKDLVWVGNLHIFLSQRNNFLQLKDDIGRIYFYMISINDYSSVSLSYGNICIAFLRFAPRMQMWLNFLSILGSLAMFVSFFSQYLMVLMIQLIRRQLMLGQDAI